MLVCTAVTAVCGRIARFDNMVLEIWSDPEITAETGYEYTRAIQFQCLGVRLWDVPFHILSRCNCSNYWRAHEVTAGSEQDGITFTGINFLSRIPIIKLLGAHQDFFHSAETTTSSPAKALQTAGHPCSKRCSTGLGRWVWSPMAPTCGAEHPEGGESFSFRCLPI